MTVWRINVLGLAKYVSFENIEDKNSSQEKNGEKKASSTIFPPETGA